MKPERFTEYFDDLMEAHKKKVQAENEAIKKQRAQQTAKAKRRRRR